MNKFIVGTLREDATKFIEDVIGLMNQSKTNITTNSEKLEAIKNKHINTILSLVKEADAINGNNRDRSFRLSDNLVHGYEIAMDNRYRVWKITIYELNKNYPDIDPTNAEYPKHNGTSYIEIELEHGIIGLRLVTYFANEIYSVNKPLNFSTNPSVTVNESSVSDIYNIIESESLRQNEKYPLCVFKKQLNKDSVLDSLRLMSIFLLDTGLLSHIHRTNFTFNNKQIFESHFSDESISNRSMSYLNNNGNNKVNVNVRSQVTYKNKRDKGRSQSGRTNLTLNLNKINDVIWMENITISPSIGFTTYLKY